MRITHTFLIVVSLLLCICASCAIGHKVVDTENNEGNGSLVLERRQDDNSTSTPSVDPSPPIDLTTETTPTATVPPSDDEESPTTPGPETTDPPPTADEDTTDDPNSTTSETTDSTTPRTPTPSTRVRTTIITTKSGGADVTTTVVSTVVDMVAPTTEPFTPDTARDSEDNDSSGLDKTQTNIVIGVVVGVGGAILVGGLGIVFWRLRKKRATNPIDDDDLMRRDGSPLVESRGDMSASTDPSPFQATLDQYHKPPGQVNASSNF